MKTIFEKCHKNNLLMELDTMCDRFVNGDLSCEPISYAIKTLAYDLKWVLSTLDKYEYSKLDKKNLIKECLETLEFYGFDKDEIWVLV